MAGTRGVILLALLFATPATVSTANVVTDWDAKAVEATVPLASVPSSPYTPYAAYRMVGIVHAAMFDAVNSIERRYRPYLGSSRPRQRRPRKRPPPPRCWRRSMQRRLIK